MDTRLLEYLIKRYPNEPLRVAKLYHILGPMRLATRATLYSK